MDEITEQPLVNTPPADEKPIIKTGSLRLPQRTRALLEHVDNSTDNTETPHRAKGGQPHNTNNTKWPTTEERQAACKKVCEELRLGYPREYLYTASWKTISRYMQEYPFDFPSDAIDEAEKDGIRRLLSIGYGGMAGKVPGFNSRTWEFIIQNRSKWKLRQDTTTNDKDLPTPILGGASVANVLHEDNSDK